MLARAFYFSHPELAAQAARRMEETHQYLDTAGRVLEIEGRGGARILVLLAPSPVELEIMAGSTRGAPQVRIGPKIRAILRMKGVRLNDGDPRG